MASKVEILIEEWTNISLPTRVPLISPARLLGYAAQLSLVLAFGFLMRPGFTNKLIPR
jgi:hypothetical protein